MHMPNKSFENSAEGQSNKSKAQLKSYEQVKFGEFLLPFCSESFQNQNIKPSYIGIITDMIIATRLLKASIVEPGIHC
jgi:hypothetical protein